MTAKKTKPATTEAGTERTEPTETEASAKATKAARGGKGAKSGKTPARAPKPRQKPARRDGEAKPERKPRTDTKQARLIAMLRARDGATVEDIASAFGWQPHTVRGALYGALKKKLGLTITSEKVEGRGRVYRIPG